MHKRLLNEATIELTIAPAGPILIKAGETGADPTRPDMEFVRTHYNGQETVYLPGSSLKGVIRSHCERIARTVDNAARRERERERLGLQEAKPLSCNPLADKGHLKAELDYACGKYFERRDIKNEFERMAKNGKKLGVEFYRRSCFICQAFGNTSLASHIRFTDAYPMLPENYEELPEEEKRKVNPNFTEERSGVAIDRVFGSVAVGPFQFEVVTRGKFKTAIHLQNFTVAQLGLLALALRDLEEQQVFLGFAKSRGLGRVEAKVGPIRLSYPPCRLEDGQLTLIGGQTVGLATRVYGVGSFPLVESGYGYPDDDATPLPDGMTYQTNEWDEPLVELAGDQLRPFWRACVRRWRAEVDG